MNLKRVVVTGIGAITPVGNNVTEYWDSLMKGVSGAGHISYFNTEKFKTKFACELKGYNPADHFDSKELSKLDRCAQYALVATEEALEDSGIDLSAMESDRVGVIYGTGIGGLMSSEQAVQMYMEQDRTPRFSPFHLLRVLPNTVSGSIALKYGFAGPNYVTSSACASSANAILDACYAVAFGCADVMVTGGTEACIIELAIGGFNAMRALSTNNGNPQSASRPFDKSRDGFVMGEGAATLVLESLDSALARGAKIYAELIGVGMSADSFHIAAPEPNGKAAVLSMEKALKSAGVLPEQVDYINTHGTSTPLGDLSECRAIAKVFGSHAPKMAINSTKSMIGHLLGAGPAVESVAIFCSMRDSVVHPTINLDELDPSIPRDWNFVSGEAQRRDVNVALSNSFGFGGHNVSLIYKKFVG
ncbi:MAG: beta-ketoacyl-ACP synthase II [Bacteroidales bacterium]|nr:beta-ketoacyl-ACP synthase II [Bacteroidales bacterium]